MSAKMYKVASTKVPPYESQPCTAPVTVTRRSGGRVLTTQHRPDQVAGAVAVALGSNVPILERRSLMRSGKVVASTYERKKR